MKVNTLLMRNIAFWAAVVVFVLLALIVFTGIGRLWGFSAMVYLAVTFFAVAAALVVLTVKLKEAGIRKFFFMLTGASAMSIPVCAILHNLVYALCVKHGWISQGGDDAVFFILTVFVWPVAFVVGALGTIVLMLRRMCNIGNEDNDKQNQPRIVG